LTQIAGDVQVDDGCDRMGKLPQLDLCCSVTSYDRAGLFLLKPLTRRIESFAVSKELLDFERKMQELEDNFIARIELYF
jgi:hypothetical protein